MIFAQSAFDQYIILDDWCTCTSQINLKLFKSLQVLKKNFFFYSVHDKKFITSSLFLWSVILTIKRDYKLKILHLVNERISLQPLIKTILSEWPTIMNMQRSLRKATIFVKFMDKFTSPNLCKKMMCNNHYFCKLLYVLYVRLVWRRRKLQG